MHVFLFSDQLMSSAKRHRRIDFWYQSIILRLIDLAVMNTRAVMKDLDRTTSMIKLQVMH